MGNNRKRKNIQNGTKRKDINKKEKKKKERRCVIKVKGKGKILAIIKEKRIEKRNRLILERKNDWKEK